jgi:hypothetical protein
LAQSEAGSEPLGSEAESTSRRTPRPRSSTSTRLLLARRAVEATHRRGQSCARRVDAASSSCGGGGVGCGCWCWAGSVLQECACKRRMQPACEAYGRAYTLPLASPTESAPHAPKRAARTRMRGIYIGSHVHMHIGTMHTCRCQRPPATRAERSRYCRSRRPHCQPPALPPGVHVRGIACIYAYVYACESLTCHMLGVACECVRLDLGWPYRHSRARNAQGYLCTCHVGLSWNWGGITNGLSRQ